MTRFIPLDLAKPDRDRAWRHIERAIVYTELGMFDHADGSLVKARRNLKRVDDIESITTVNGLLKLFL